MPHIEDRLRADGYEILIGIDEAGRGPLAGPVVASAVALQAHNFESKIKDSKKLTEKEREKAFEEIYHHAYVGIGIVSEAAIDHLNILNATFHAMNTAVKQLIPQIPQNIREVKDFSKKVCLLVDGNRFKSDVPYPCRTVIGGDNLVLSISCASIIAKVTRDRILLAYDQIFPAYGFKSHKGYPTVKHKAAIRDHGPSAIQRMSFSY